MATSREDTAFEPDWYLHLRMTLRDRQRVAESVQRRPGEMSEMVAEMLQAAAAAAAAVLELHQPRTGVRYTTRMDRGQYATIHNWCPTCCDLRCFEGPGDTHVRDVPDCCDTIATALIKVYGNKLPDVVAQALRDQRPEIRLIQPGERVILTPGRVRMFTAPHGGKEVELVDRGDGTFDVEVGGLVLPAGETLTMTYVETIDTDGDR